MTFVCLYLSLFLIYLEVSREHKIIRSDSSQATVQNKSLKKKSALRRVNKNVKKKKSMF